MLAGMDCRHASPLDEGKCFDCQCLVQILLLDVFANAIFNGHHVEVYCIKEHTGCMIALVVSDVHCIVTDVLWLFWLIRDLGGAEYDDGLSVIVRHSFLKLRENLLYPSPAYCLLQNEELLVLIEKLAGMLGVEGRLPLPGFADGDKLVSSSLELVWRQVPADLEDVLLRRGVPLLRNSHYQLVRFVLHEVRDHAFQKAHLYIMRLLL